MELIVDRLEEEYIVCEDENKNIVNILKDEVEDEVKEGDILIFVDGKYIVNKEKNLTSRDVVNIACKKLNTRHIGHTGTLDPIASGVLVVAIGKYTKLVDIITSEKKEYIATMKLGELTDTLDTEGVFRLIESIPSPKAEPFKMWLANLGSERIDEVFDSEKAVNRAVEYYRRKVILMNG